MNKHDEVGQRALHIALTLFPALRPVIVGSTEDRNGRDALMPNGTSIQVKGDTRIAESGNLCFEIFKKVHEKPDGQWYHSPSDAKVYVFVTEGLIFWIPVDALAKACIGRTLKQINPTCLCFLIPYKAVVPPGIVKKHNMWGTRVML